MEVPRRILEPGCSQRQPQLCSPHSTGVRNGCSPRAEQGCVPEPPTGAGTRQAGAPPEASALLCQYLCKDINIHTESLQMSHVSVPSNY